MISVCPHKLAWKRGSQVRILMNHSLITKFYFGESFLNYCQHKSIHNKRYIIKRIKNPFRLSILWEFNMELQEFVPLISYDNLLTIRHDEVFLEDVESFSSLPDTCSSRYHNNNNVINMIVIIIIIM